MGPNQSSGRPGVSPTVTRIELAGFIPFVLLLIGWDIVRTYLPAIILWLGTADPADQQQPAPPPIAGPAGSYTFSIPGAVRISYGPTWIRIEWDAAVAPPIKPAPVDPGVVKPPAPVDPEPPQPPSPAPPEPVTPVPQVGPIAGNLFLVAVYDKSKFATYPAGQQALLASKTIGPALEKSQIFWRPFDVNNPELADRPDEITGAIVNGSGWASKAKAVGLPALLIIGQGGAIVPMGTGFSLPVDEASVLALAKKLRGR